jgi:hypothetical protein
MLDELFARFNAMSVDEEWIFVMIVVFAVMAVLFHRLFNRKEN